MNFFSYVAPDQAQSYAERLELYSEKALDLGEVPTESDETAEKMMAWLRSGVEAEIVKPEQAFEFTYDNSGPYKYGVHFGIGDQITVRSDRLGVSAKQRLVTVTTNYEAGKAKAYAFEFGEQTIRGQLVAEINRAISAVAKKTGTARKAVE